MKKLALALPAVALSSFAFGALLAPGRAQEAAKAAAPASQSGGAPQGFPDLVKGLKSTPGCLGVEAAQTASGKQVLFAWFENKKAALAWYGSEMHAGAMKAFFPGHTPGIPLKDIKDDGRPILTIASLTRAKPGAQGTVGGANLPLSQIAIELYQPAPGGVAVGGRFAPASLKVPGLRDVASIPTGK